MPIRSAEPAFSPNPVAELAATNSGGTITPKLRVLSQPAPYTLVQGAAPVSAGVRCVQHFPLLGLLPPPTEGWSDITALYVARDGLPPASGLSYCPNHPPKRGRKRERVNPEIGTVF